MTYAEMDVAMNDFVDEYFATGKYALYAGYAGVFGGTKAEVTEYRKRLRAFIADNGVPEELAYEKVARSRMGESFYLANGYSILSDEGLA